MFKRLQKKRGFTIVEMVVVVAVIAVIAAVVVTSVKSALYKAEKLGAETAVNMINAELVIEGARPTDEEEAAAIANGAGIDNIGEIFSGQFLLAYDSSENVFVLLESEEDKPADGFIIYNFDSDDGNGENNDDKNDNTGDVNTDDDNTDDDNTDDENDNTGDVNTGDDNTGDVNTDDDNTDDDNTDDENNDTAESVEDKMKAAAEKPESLFVRCDKNGDEDSKGGYVKYGYYPQSQATDSDECEYLSAKYCKEAESGGYTKGDNWTAFSYYVAYDGGKQLSSSAWYVDADMDGDGRPDYRGVCFTAYRAAYIDGSGASSGDDVQSGNGYKVNSVYWFKYEPIIWRIVVESGNTYTLVCKDIIDCGQYYTTLPDDVAFSASYAYEFLSGDFLSAALSSAERNKLIGVMIEEYKTASVYIPVYNDNEAKAYVTTSDGSAEIESADLKKTPTEYAECLGADSAGDYGYWWLGSRHYDYYTSAYDSYVMFVMSDGSLSYYVYSSSETGYVPAVTVTASSD